MGSLCCHEIFTNLILDKQTNIFSFATNIATVHRSSVMNQMCCNAHNCAYFYTGQFRWWIETSRNKNLPVACLVISIIFDSRFHQTVKIRDSKKKLLKMKTLGRFREIYICILAKVQFYPPVLFLQDDSPEALFACQNLFVVYDLSAYMFRLKLLFVEHPDLLVSQKSRAEI